MSEVLYPVAVDGILAVVLSASFLVSCAPEEPMPAGTASLTGPRWTVDPEKPGSNLPPVGRSLFDFLVTVQDGSRETQVVPYPFSRLTDLIEQRLPKTGRPSLKKVLIPVGRSLQRNAADPDFFEYPRVVVAVDTEPALEAHDAGMLLKDRLFLGYQEKAGIIEVISYNEEAGRFEFQVVTDYRAGGTPQILYARRDNCVPCHQNQAPIFSRPLWDETNANPGIAFLLRAEKPNFYGVPVRQGVDFPNAIDDATDRANMFSAYQVLWQNGCGPGDADRRSIECRANAFIAVLQYRLSGYRWVSVHTDGPKNNFMRALAGRWQEYWPLGLAIPNPDIPNRNPLASISRGNPLDEGCVTKKLTDTDMGELIQVERDLEPFIRRRPLEIWPSPEIDPAITNRVISGLGGFLTTADIQRLDKALYAKGEQSGKSKDRYRVPCEFNSEDAGRGAIRLQFHCPAQFSDEGEIALEGTIYLRNGSVLSGRVPYLEIAQQDRLHNLSVDRGSSRFRNESWRIRFSLREQSAGLHARLLDGNAIQHVELFWSEKARLGAPKFSGQAEVTILEDFLEVMRTVEKMATQARSGTLDALGPGPFRRTSLMSALFSELGIGPLAWCCLADNAMPSPQLE